MLTFLQQFGVRRHLKNKRNFRRLLILHRHSRARTNLLTNIKASSERAFITRRTQPMRLRALVAVRSLGFSRSAGRRHSARSKYLFNKRFKAFVRRTKSA